MAYIKYLPKDILLYELWLAARNSPYFYYCVDKLPTLTLEIARSDLNEMISTGRNFELTNYYGRMLYLDIRGDFCNVEKYEIYNGKNTALNIIKKLKEQQLRQIVLKFYTF